ncbi:MAG: glycerophosphodiester phosphodiesterase family protein [Planctomycetia bacterium]|nr:glycerophosphodiester phosphodiesterase family protein [Planctomycetia bacterium]
MRLLRTGLVEWTGRRSLFCGVVLAVGTLAMGVLATEMDPNGRAMPGQRLTQRRWIEPFWNTNPTFGEGLLFIRENDQPASVKLFFPVTKILQVRSATHEVVYENGRDYTFDAATNRLVLTGDSRIPFITESQMYPSKDDPTPNKYPFHRGDPEHFMIFGEGAFFHQLQTEVTYTHADSEAFEAIRPRFVGDAALPKTFAKLRNREPFTLAISGDSISTGANASGAVNAEPYQPDYPTLVADGLADLYRTDVRLANCAVGGWTTVEGVNDVARPAAENPQLVIIAYGMNDSGGRDAAEYAANTKKIIDGFRAVNPDTEFVLVASSLPNAEWAYPNLERFPQYRDALAKLCEEIPGCVMANVTDVWAKVVEGKNYYDLTGNGVNHPNDFAHRLYAQVILGILTDPTLAERYFATPVPVRAPIVAHRGFSQIAPENTLAAARAAVDAGASGCECDVRPTSDGVIILTHDNNLKRCTGLDAVPESVPYATYETLDAGSWKAPEYRGERIPTLREWLDVLKPTGCVPVVEIKSADIEQPVVDAIRQAGYLGDCAVIAFSKETARKVRQLAPELTVAWLCGDKFEGTPLELADQMCGTLDWCGTDVIDIAHTLVTEEFVRIMHERGYTVWCWTVNDPARMRQLLEWGVDSITTDCPDRLVEVRASLEKAE